jgi:septum formation protein
VVKTPIVLASASPRRRELLRAAGLEFEVRPSAADESLVGEPDPVAAALELAERKARAVLPALGAGPALVIGADTIVAVPRGAAGHRLLGKPESPEEARDMLCSLSGTRHLVVTGVCVLAAPATRRWAEAESTWVTMRPITAREVEDYVASGEWRDRAGGYAIQETADRFVTALEGGGFDNVVGLPVALTLRLLAAGGAGGGPR